MNELKTRATIGSLRSSLLRHFHTGLILQSGIRPRLRRHPPLTSKALRGSPLGAYRAPKLEKRRAQRIDGKLGLRKQVLGGCQNSDSSGHSSIAHLANAEVRLLIVARVQFFAVAAFWAVFQFDPLKIAFFIFHGSSLAYPFCFGVRGNRFPIWFTCIACSCFVQNFFQAFEF